jgi:hypothetical protein
MTTLTFQPRKSYEFSVRQCLRIYEVEPLLVRERRKELAPSPSRGEDCDEGGISQ